MKKKTKRSTKDLHERAAGKFESHSLTEVPGISYAF
jgi:hypothetical protein